MTIITKTERLRQIAADLRTRTYDADAMAEALEIIADLAEPCDDCKKPGLTDPDDANPADTTGTDA